MIDLLTLLKSLMVSFNVVGIVPDAPGVCVSGIPD